MWEVLSERRAVPVTLGRQSETASRRKKFYLHMSRGAQSGEFLLPEATKAGTRRPG